ncbi:MAG: hypothetical protein LBC40_07945 [Dysgonamonadaceae bacterium]|jgi:hypothetical protein|nr:hypothetical protein [Dysgonamonadaceae bacterium]
MKAKAKTYLLGLWLPVCGMTYLLSSCEKEMQEAGRQVPVRFSLQTSPFGSETGLRQGPAGDRVLETVEIPAGDNLIISAELVEEPASPTRGANSPGIEDGAKIRIIAYNGNSPVDGANKIYTYNSLTQALSEDEMMLTAGGPYKIVAYSYNSDADPATPDGNGQIPMIAPTEDLLYGAVDYTPGEDGSVSTTIPLFHQFMRFSYQVTYADVDMGIIPGNSTVGASLTTNYKAKLTLPAGTVVPDGLASSQALALFSATDPYRMGYTGAATGISVSLSGLIKGPSPKMVILNGLNLTFKQTAALVAGGSYRLNITFKNGIPYAGSNIYWDDTQLTFKKHGYIGEENENMYQGVFFKWGSLVGISPAQTASSIYFSAGTKNGADGTPIYVYTSNGWEKTNVATATDDPTKYGAFNADPGSGTDDERAWSRIPYYVHPTGDYYGSPYVNFFDENSVGDNTAMSNIGDICRFLDSDYRLPTADEMSFGGKGFRSWNYNESIVENKWSRLGPETWNTDFSLAAADGRSVSITAGGTIFGATFPASGRRTDSGRLASVGSSGFYWSGSVLHSTTDAYNLRFFTTMAYQSDEYFLVGYPVRCVKK